MLRVFVTKTDTWRSKLHSPQLLPPPSMRRMTQHTTRFNTQFTNTYAITELPLLVAQGDPRGGGIWVHREASGDVKLLKEHAWEGRQAPLGGHPGILSIEPTEGQGIEELSVVQEDILQPMGLCMSGSTTSAASLVQRSCCTVDHIV